MPSLGGCLVRAVPAPGSWPTSSARNADSKCILHLLIMPTALSWHCMRNPLHTTGLLVAPPRAEMWGYSIGAAVAGVRHELPEKLQIEPSSQFGLDITPYGKGGTPTRLCQMGSNTAPARHGALPRLSTHTRAVHCVQWHRARRRVLNTSAALHSR